MSRFARSGALSLTIGGVLLTTTASVGGADEARSLRGAGWDGDLDTPREPDRLILIDTSAWIEFPRDTGSGVCRTVDALLDPDLEVLRNDADFSALARHAPLRIHAASAT